MKFNKLCPSDISTYENNSRVHSQHQIEEIANSIKEFGFTNPVLVDEHRRLLAGHGRLLAARHINLPKIPVIVLEGLTEAQKRAYTIADNKIALNSDWDEELLKQEVLAILEDNDEDQTYLELIGLNDNEIQELLESEDKANIRRQSKKLADELLADSNTNDASNLKITVYVAHEDELYKLKDELEERGYRCKI